MSTSDACEALGADSRGLQAPGLSLVVRKEFESAVEGAWGAPQEQVGILTPSSEQASLYGVSLRCGPSACRHLARVPHAGGRGAGAAARLGGRTPDLPPRCAAMGQIAAHLAPHGWGPPWLEVLWTTIALTLEIVLSWLCGQLASRSINRVSCNIGPMLAEDDTVRPNSARFGQIGHDLGQLCDRFRPSSARVGQTWPDLGHIFPYSAKSARFRLSLWTTSSRCWTNFASTEVDLDVAQGLTKLA